MKEHIPIVVVGTELSKLLADYFARIGFGEESVHDCSTFEESEECIRRHKPSVLIVRMNGHDEEALENVTTIAKLANPLARVIAIKDTPGADAADVVLPLAVDFDQFADTLHALIISYAQAPRVGFRGGFRMLPPTPPPALG